MRMQIKEFARLTKVSVRTLHYYDEIGLLKPAGVDKWTGYRYYDGQSLLRMQEILFYRELDFSLKSIGEILSSPHYNTRRALQEQKMLLKLKKERLERLIAAVDRAMEGKNVMSAFDSQELEKYKAEAREKWGKTDAYKEHAEKTKNYSRGTWNQLAGEMDGIFAEFAACKAKGETAESDEAQGLVQKLQGYITENYYHCTREILAGLGQMYAADERFRKNIDRHGAGTAVYAARAISVYCGK